METRRSRESVGLRPRAFGVSRLTHTLLMTFRSIHCHAFDHARSAGLVFVPSHQRAADVGVLYVHLMLLLRRQGMSNALSGFA